MRNKQYSDEQAARTNRKLQTMLSETELDIGKGGSNNVGYKQHIH